MGPLRWLAVLGCASAGWPFATGCSSSVAPQLDDAALRDSEARDAAIDDQPSANAADASDAAEGGFAQRPVSKVMLAEVGQTVLLAALHARDSSPTVTQMSYGACVERRERGARYVNGGTLTLSILDRSATAPFGVNGEPQYYYEFGGSAGNHPPLTISLSGNDAFPPWSVVVPSIITDTVLLQGEGSTYTPGAPLRVTWQRGRSAASIIVALRGQQCGEDPSRFIECAVPSARTSIEIPSAAVERILPCAEHRVVLAYYSQTFSVTAGADAPVQVVILGPGNSFALP